ncbi:hypothetical protein LCGC14_1970390 [marine sediment metagenome]|uniref:Uncharacterized protein n=1 Tax=marine sediment metagenome TaxID=412755 RepID=A0A0F9FCE8_9ZZZZ
MMTKQSPGIRFKPVFVVERKQPSGGYAEVSRHETAQQALDAREQAGDRVRAKKALDTS